MICLLTARERKENPQRIYFSHLSSIFSREPWVERPNINVWCEEVVAELLRTVAKGTSHLFLGRRQGYLMAHNSVSVGVGECRDWYGNGG
jgi:hypothetical protein